ncbi:MAG: preprotein translocase subunit YajC [Pseudomonadota bacterium]
MTTLADFATLAAAPAGGGAGMFLMNIAPFILIIVVFYFLLIRPQQKKLKMHREMVENLRRGDEVVTQGGVIGKVTRIADTEVTVEIAEGVRVKVLRPTIQDVRARTEPANDKADDE